MVRPPPSEGWIQCIWAHTFGCNLCTAWISVCLVWREGSECLCGLSRNSFFSSDIPRSFYKRYFRVRPKYRDFGGGGPVRAREYPTDATKFLSFEREDWKFLLESKTNGKYLGTIFFISLMLMPEKVGTYTVE